MRVAVACGLMTGLLTGCGLQSSRYGSSSSGSSWSSGDEDARPGISQGSVRVVTLYNGDGPGFKVGFWADHSQAFSAERNKSGSGKSEFTMSVGKVGGTPTQIQMIRANGLADVITIGETEYPVASGDVFLFRTDGELLQVSQISLDEDWDQGERSYEEIGAEDPAISAFFAKLREPDIEPSADK